MDRIKSITGRGAALVGAVGTMATLAFIMAGPASAAPADPIVTAFDDMEAKITLYGGAIVALVVLAVGIFLGLKYLRKGVSKA